MIHRLAIKLSDGEEHAISFADLNTAQKAAERLGEQKNVVSVRYMGPNVKGINK